MRRKLSELPVLFIPGMILFSILVALAGVNISSRRQYPPPSPTPLSATCVPGPPATCVPAQPVTITPVPTETPEAEPTLKPILDVFNVSYYTTEDDITWSGTEPRYGIVACPSIFPFGTRFVILTRSWQTEEFICEDRHPDPRSFGLDIWYPSWEAARESEAMGERTFGTYWVLILFDDRPLEEQEIVVDKNPFIPKTLDAYYDEERRKWISPADREED